MRITVTGATGFVGRHITAALLDRGHKVTAVSRSIEKAREFPWFDNVDFIACDLHSNFDPVLKSGTPPEVLIHTAWPGLPKYNEFFHLDRNLPADINFLSAAVSSGISHVLVTGTCLEYGLKFGPLDEDGETAPITPYGLAKDTLRKSLQLLQQRSPFTLQWVRLFYMYGEGQSSNSLLSQLDRAIDNGEPIFNMSQGDQLRDYLPVSSVAAHIARLVENSECAGVINCCSGTPQSVIELVQSHCRERNSAIILNRGFYDYPDYEPLAFWGRSKKLSQMIDEPTN
jgi:dTDP-6-deoxy-L-talose 4-dehydrogenase (NAD+)